MTTSPSDIPEAVFKAALAEWAATHATGEVAAVLDHEDIVELIRETKDGEQ